MMAPKRCIFIYGAHPNTKNIDLVKQLEGHDIVIMDSDIQRMSKDDSFYLSFKINIEAKDFEKSLDPSVWPKHIHVRKFHFRKLKPAAVAMNSTDVNVSTPTPRHPPTSTPPHLRNKIVRISSKEIFSDNRFAPLRESMEANPTQQ